MRPPAAPGTRLAPESERHERLLQHVSRDLLASGCEHHVSTAAEHVAESKAPRAVSPSEPNRALSAICNSHCSLESRVWKAVSEVLSP